MTYKELADKLRQYPKNARSGKTVRMMLLTAVEKQIPAKPHFEGDGYWNGELIYDTWVCPNCDADFETETETHKYCPTCGQAIDWEEK